MKHHSMLSNEIKCDAEMQASKHYWSNAEKMNHNIRLLQSITPIIITNVTGVEEEDTKLMHQEHLIHMQ